MATRTEGGAPIRVLWLAKGLGPGGMERLLEAHARNGDRVAFDYRAAYLVDRPHSVVPALEELGVPCTRLGNGNGNDPRWVAELRTYVRRERIDVVHIHSPLVAALARPALRSMRPRPALVYTEHNSWDCYSAPTRVANALTYRLDDAQVAVSDAAGAKGRFKHPVETLVHGIDLDAVRARSFRRAELRAELGLDDDAVVVVTVANLRTEKAYDVLLAAAATALAADPNLVFLSVGQGPLADEMEAERDRLGLGERFRFLGFRDDVHDLLAAADVFCLSSRHEGLPVALMEASAAGLPVVATAVGGLPDVVEEGATGLLVASGDAAGLARALLAVSADAGLRQRLGARSAELAHRFDAAAPIRRLESLYRSAAR